MISTSTLVRRLVPAAVTIAAAVVVAGCGDSAAEPFTVAGAYTATTFRVTSQGASPVDVLAQGGSIVLDVRPDRTTAGTLVVPGTVTGGQPLTADLTGSASQTGNRVRFQQSADTFIRDLEWTVDGATLRVAGAPVGGAEATITLTRR